MPESRRPASLLAAVLLVCGAAACGPSNGGGNPATYIIVFALSDTGGDDLTALEFTVEYENGDFTGAGTSVVCTLTDGVDANEATFTDDDVDTLTVEIDATADDLVEGTEIVECKFFSTIQPTSNDFTIDITAATGADSDDIDVVVTSTDLEGS